MKKYTIIYTNGIMIGSHMNHTTHFARVETDNLKQLLNSKYDGAVWFVFEGWPELEGEFADLDD